MADPKEFGPSEEAKVSLVDTEDVWRPTIDLPLRDVTNEAEAHRD